MSRKRKIAFALAVTCLLFVASCGGNQPEEAEAALEMRYFDVKDLLPQIAILSGGSFSGGSGVYVPPEPEPEEPGIPEDPDVVHAEDLLAFIRAQTEGDAVWAGTVPDGGPALLIRNRIVIARNTPTVLDAVQGLLDELLASASPRAFIEARR